MKKIFLLATSVLLLSACASSGTRDGMVYRDGSWYAPAAEGRGDYYTSTPRTHYDYAYDYPWDFGIGVVPYGGYCPVVYHWCTSYGPWYDPWWYQPWAYYQYPRRHHHRDRHDDDIAGPGGEDEDAPSPRIREPRERPRPDFGGERPVRGPRSGGSGEGRRQHGGMGRSGASGGGGDG